MPLGLSWRLLLTLMLWRYRLVPPYVEEDEFEDLLATDSLFVEYFNAFLQLPTFPEPLCFNKETGGFEVHTNAKKELAQEIKAAIRAGKRRKRIYRPVHNHSFSSIPLIAIDRLPEQEEKEINTSFTVKTLNKEQGIQWVKRERLPLFLESDFYLEYRLAKLVSQAQIAQGTSDSVTVKLDYAPRVRNTAKEEEEVEEEVDETEVMMRNAYVCMGNAGTTDTEAWVSQAKITMDTATTPSNHPRPTSAMATYPYALATGRPASARSNPSSRKLDSGVWSPAKSSLFMGSVDYQSIISGSDYVDDIPLGGDLFDPGPRPPGMPRPSDQVCAVALPPAQGIRRGGRAYATPRAPTPSTTKIEEKEEKVETGSASTEDLGIEEDHVSVSTEGSTKEDTQKTSEKPVVFKNLDQLGNVIVATVLKNALSEVTGLSSKEINKRTEIQTLFRDQEQFSDLSLEELANLEVGLSQEGSRDEEEREEDGADTRRSILGQKESDEDSVLNSDEDYEEEMDDFFRKNKYKEQTLSSLKGLCAFKKFLVGSHGERNWHLWMDIERAKLMTDSAELAHFLLAMRERYQKPGGVYELSPETKRLLGLCEPTHWTLDTLVAIQNTITEPLVLYWAPRFLVKQKVKVKPELNPLYLQQITMKTKPDSHPQPHPPVRSMLPLRPKTCMPRMRKVNMDSTQNSLQISDAFEDIKTDQALSSLALPQINLTTTPPVGQKRIYDLPEGFKTGPNRIMFPSNQKDRNTANVNVKVKTPRDLLKATLRVQKTRPASAPVRLGSLTSLDGPMKSPVVPPPPKYAHWEVGSEVSGAGESLSPSQTPRMLSSRRSSSSTDSGVSSVYAGGRRMEALLQALSNETKSGGIMRKHLERSNNQLWKNCFDFWLGLQDYHELYYSEVIDPYSLQVKAKSLHSKYIVVGAPFSIQCNSDIQTYIYHRIEPPYEELFDDAEEYALSVLFDAWTALLATDVVTFDKIELIEAKRKLDQRNKYLLSLQRRGIIKERPDTPDLSMEGYEDPVYDETLLDKIPAEFREWTLDKLVHHRLELEHFKQYLAENYASMDLMCWMDIEAFRRIPHSEEKRRDMKAKDIKTKYFTKKYFFGPNSPAGKEGQEKVMQAGGGWGKLLDDRPPTASLLEAQKYVRERLEKNWLPRFLVTEEFGERQHPKVGMDDAVEDVMIQRKKKSQAIWRMIESKWVSSSKDILTFRKALMNPVTSQQFRKFVSIKGENFENDVLFYQEVQRYKDLCHIHSDRPLIQQKTLAIINCFIDSPIPPALQVDITQDMADKLVERKLEATPYLFRESQLTVFRVLFSHWSDFCTFRSNMTDEKLTPTLERHRRKARLEEKRKAKVEEAKRSKEEARRRAMGLPPDADPDDAFDPFARGSDDEDEAATGTGSGHDKSAVSWSYSQYLHGFEKEDVLNDVDESTFSSLSDRTAASHDGHNEAGEKTLALDSTTTSGKITQRKSKGEISNLGTPSTDKTKKVRVKSPKERLNSLPKEQSKSPTSPKDPKTSARNGSDAGNQVHMVVLGGATSPPPATTRNGAGPRITRRISPKN